MVTLLQDLRYALRQLVRNPGFAAVAILTLALGIGANTAVFSVVNAVLLKPLPYFQADRITYLGWNWGRGPSSLTPLKFDYWRRNSHAFSAIATYRGGESMLGTDERSRPLRGLRASGDFFRVLGVGPALGREFTAEEDVPGGPNVVVLSDETWRTRLGADPRVIGSAVLLGKEEYTVVGVMPPGFHFVESDGNDDFIAPLRLKVDPKNEGHNFPTLARLAPGVTRRQAEAETAILSEQFRAEYPEYAGKKGRMEMADYATFFVGDLQRPLWTLLGAVGFVLLLACVNVANLLLARASDRTREMAVRAALGAGRGRVARQLVTESLLLALLAGAAGVVLGRWTLAALLRTMPHALPRADGLGLDTRVLGFALGISLLTGVVFGLVAALPVLRSNLTGPIRQSGRGAPASRGGRRVRNALVASETAVAMMLLSGAGLLIASFVSLRSVDAGFDANGLLTVSFESTPGGYDAARLWTLQREALEQIRAMPGVSAAATAANLPLEHGMNIPMTIAGRPDASEGDVEWRAVSPDYAQALGISMVRGRGFLPLDDAPGAPVVVVNEAFARRYFPDQDPIGQRVAVGEWKGQAISPEWAEPPRTIVGVMADVKDMALDRPAKRTVFVPQSQVPGAGARMPKFLIRTSNPAQTTRAVRALFSQLDPRFREPVFREMHDVVDASIAGQRFSTMLMSIFAGLALVLTAIGLYGVLSYLVRQRTAEIGLRMALGAQPESVLRMVVRQGMAMVGAGLAVGLLGALGLMRLLSSMLFGISAADPRPYFVVIVLLLAVGFLASLLPARRATRVDPMIALRSE